MKILVMNAGSSSQKSALYEVGNPLPDRPPNPLWEASIDWAGQPGIADLKISTQAGVKVHKTLPNTPRDGVIHSLLASLWQGETQVVEAPEAIALVGHRVVHGGDLYRESVRITPDVKGAIARFARFAPLHNPANLEGINAIEQVLGSIPQVAVFDTAFHSSLSPAATVYPIPYTWYEQGIRRYGFHGTSHRYCAQRAAEMLGHPPSLRLIICHLGNGASLSAVRDGQCIDTTMGFTPLEGLMMGSRSGSVDPGILIHLLRQEGLSADDLDRMLNRESGLLGLSGVSSDLRQVMGAIAQGNAQANLALEVYHHRLRSLIGSLIPGLGGLDALVFTAGIGENSPAIRAAASQGLAFLGLQIDPKKNGRSPAEPDRDIATADSAIRALVIHTQEDWMILRDCWQISQTQGAG